MAVHYRKALPAEIEKRVLQLSREDNVDYMDELIRVIETGLSIHEAKVKGITISPDGELVISDALIQGAGGGVTVGPRREGTSKEVRKPETTSADFAQFLLSMPNVGKDSDFDRHAGEFPDYDPDAVDDQQRGPNR